MVEDARRYIGSQSQLSFYPSGPPFSHTNSYNFIGIFFVILVVSTELGDTDTPLFNALIPSNIFKLG